MIKNYFILPVLLLGAIILISCHSDSILTSEPQILLTEVEAPNIVVVRPNGLDELKLGSKFSIYWRLLEGTDWIRILLYKDGKEFMTIVHETFNDALYKWQIPTNIEPSNKYSIRVESLNDNTVGGFSHTFRIYRGNNSP